ncbi:DNA methyltransferase family protein [Staphylococcus pasteuri]|uniref:Eco57I restriction-modification methylase domain-containing protein n=1 Tax=Staphylococcus pasteuri TaxID=45972 RepID=UPI002DBDE3AA|nr:Eco57I restriction-modification methylase domain-containing protein [Staphylococcus pasteuri]MEB7434851.1 Eco57I restriction-modification methylase domain-containing protein [Staphylococcus pasteuri]
MVNLYKKIKTIISNYNLIYREKVIEFINKNPENLTYEELSLIAEFVNNRKNETAAYYTSIDMLQYLKDTLPDFNKDIIRVLEPSVGIGNLLPILQEKYKSHEKVIIDVIDIDNISLKICKLLNKYRINNNNIEINYINGDFLEMEFNSYYDLVLGNPPFLRKNEVPEWSVYAEKFNDNITKNLSGLFMTKSIGLASNILLIMPKYFLHNSDFKLVRDECKKNAIKTIIDFGEKGFKGVLIETIAILLKSNEVANVTETYSVTLNKKNITSQSKITDDSFPNWLIYRNDFFDQISKKMKNNIFNVYRDRSITNKVINEDNDKKNIRVLKSRNIKRDGTGIINIDGYDTYISEKALKSHNAKKYLNRDDVFLTPNMTYYPRVIKKPLNCVANGSVAILENKTSYNIRKEHLNFWNSEEFTKYYAIARNYSTRSLNIDKNSVFYFGLIDYDEDGIK